MQDGPSTCGPSNSKSTQSGITGGSDIPRGAWYAVGGGESGWATPDPVDPNVVWSTASGRGSMGGIVVRTSSSGTRMRDVEVWPVSPNGHAAEGRQVSLRLGLSDRDLAAQPHEGVRRQSVRSSNRERRTTLDRHQSRPHAQRQARSRVRRAASLATTSASNMATSIYAIAESPITPGLLWVGTNDGSGAAHA